MLVKCETKCNRVKGLSFHPKLSWILASLHNGVIQLWDFRIGSLIDRFEEHEGPVRGVDFHTSQPLFVSGGDDYKIKLWNYRQRRCLFTLLGHLDYIRTVQFHPEHPWILSASDDQTVRIWNWQNRSCIAVLAGHNHYVMCAQFHPKQELLVSASLDQTIRVWDISGLMKKTAGVQGGVASAATLPSLTGGVGQQMMMSSSGGGSSGFMVLHPQHVDMFAASDAVCKFILEGHDRGVNWAAFHPTMPLIASGADDRLVKLWRYNETKWWEVDTFRGHFNNVSSVLFHPTRELLLSNSEDRTIRVWDITKRILVHTFRRENDRFWVISALKNSNIIAVGHDSGMVVFKLDRERPAAQTVGDSIFYVKDRWVTVYNTTTGTNVSFVACRRPANAMTCAPLTLAINQLNPSEVDILVFYKEAEGGAYDLITCPDIASATSSPAKLTTKQGTGEGVAFVARNRFAVLEASGAISIYNMNCALSKRFDPPVTTDRIFYAGNNRLLLKSEERVYLYDLTARKSLAEVTCPGGARYAIWSDSGDHVALVCKHHIVLANNKLELLWSVHENIRVKGGAWDSLGAFVYSTLSHIKYCLPNGDSGIIRCLGQPIYLMKVERQKIWALDRESQTMRCIPLNCTEYLFKLALHQRKFDQVALLIKNGRLCGNAVVSYLRKKGFPEVALQFVSDPQTRFNLALEDANLAEAMDTAVQLNDRNCWERLALAAVRQGNFQTAEVVYQKMKHLEKLSFFYAITGNVEKLKKMLKIAESRKDVQGRFYNALLLGDVEERIRIFAEVGLLPLAALTAKTYELDEIAEALEEAIERMDLDVGQRPIVAQLVPPTPLIDVDALTTLDWPKVETAESRFESVMERAEKMPADLAAAELQKKLTGTPTKAGRAPGTRDVTTSTEKDVFGVFDIEDDDGEEPVGEGWHDLDDVGDFGGLGAVSSVESPTEMLDETEDNVRIGTRRDVLWTRGQPRLSALVAAGRYAEALEYLVKRIGLLNAEPLEPLFRKIASSTYTSLPMLPFFPSKQLPLFESGTMSDPGPPIKIVTISCLLSLLKDAHKLVTAGKVVLALEAYRSILHHLVFADASGKDEEDQLVEFLNIASTYALAMLLESERQKVAETDMKRSTELAAYLASCKLQSAHQFLTLRRGMTVAWKAQNYVTAAAFARRLIQGTYTAKSASEVIAQAKKVLAASEQKGTERYAIDFDPSEMSESARRVATLLFVDNLVVCASSLTRILPNVPTVKCPFCGAVAKSQFTGTLCALCRLSELGAKVLGLQFQTLL